MLQHWGSHCLTYLDELDWHLTIGLAHRSMIPTRVDGPQSEKVVPGLSQTKEKSRIASGITIPSESQPL
jgi:hypothetical protein